LGFKIFDLQRIGGEAVFLVYGENGFVKKAYFVSRAPVRGFERIVRGKNPVFVINAVMRICGICHSAHGIASAEAIEDAMGISPPVNGRLVRESIGLVNRIQSHLIHLFMLIPDIVIGDSKTKFFIENIRLLDLINKLLAKLGGSPTHPPFIVVGGIARSLSEEVVGEAIDISQKILEHYREFKKSLLEETRDSDKVSLLMDKRANNKLLATHPYYGDRYNIGLDKIHVLRYEDYRKENLPDEIKKTTSLIALYNGEIVECGPRARLALFHDFSGNSLWDIQLARLLEIEISIRRVIDLLKRIEYGEPFSTGVLTYRAGRGVGVYEAPRGTLIHRVVLDTNGRVKEYRIIVPTMFNIPVMESVAEKFPVKYSDLIPRIYDPCIPCSTHIVKFRLN